MKNKTFLPLRLQFFAESSEDQNDDVDNKENNGDETENNDVDDSEEKERTFTQAQVSAMMAKEKRQGKQSVLNALGFKNEEDAKKAFALLTALQESQKTEQQKLKDVEAKASENLKDAEKRAKDAEDKLSCLTAGVKSDAIEDVIAIASLKVTDEKSLEDVLKEMKEDKKYSSFFEGAKNKNTGGNPGHSGGKDNKTSFAANLAKNNASNAGKKSSFFDD